MGYSFTVVQDGRLSSDNPKLEAYQYMARLQSHGHVTSTTFHEDGSVSVAAPGLMTFTFYKEGR